MGPSRHRQAQNMLSGCLQGSCTGGWWEKGRCEAHAWSFGGCHFRAVQPMISTGWERSGCVSSESFARGMSADQSRKHRHKRQGEFCGASLGDRNAQSENGSKGGKSGGRVSRNLNRHICYMKLNHFQAQVPAEGLPVLSSHLAEVVWKHCPHVTEPLQEL